MNAEALRVVTRSWTGNERKPTQIVAVPELQNASGWFSVQRATTRAKPYLDVEAETPREALMEIDADKSCFATFDGDKTHNCREKVLRWKFSQAVP